MNKLRAMLERMDGVTLSSNVFHCVALLAALFMVTGAFQLGAHDHDDHDNQDANCVVCAIASTQTAKLSAANSFAAPLLRCYPYAPTDVAARCIPGTFSRPKSRGPPTASPLQ